MTRLQPSTSAFRLRAFTLVELVLALTIVAILMAIAIPTLGGLSSSRKAREPLEKVADLAQQVRARAIHEGRPYQLLMTSEKIYAARFATPYESARQLEDALTIADKNQTNDSQAVHTTDEKDKTRVAAPPPWREIYVIPQGLRLTARYWDEEREQEITIDQPCRWVFQPSGLCRPLTLTINKDPIVLRATFDAMTGEIIKESSDGL